MIEYIYITASLASICAMAPQIKQLLVTKRTDGLNLTSWIIWAVAQTGTTFYAVSINATAFIAISSIWLCYYLAMVSLIVHYRRRNRARIMDATPVTIAELLPQTDS